jgi:hypothetical protein
MDMIYYFENLLQRLSYWLPVYFLVLMVGEAIFLLFRFKKAFEK